MEKVSVVVADESSLLVDVTSVNRRTITSMQLMILIYFWTSGGPFGIEPAVGAGGVVVTAVTLVAISFCWAFPQAIMAAELSLMMNVNGGNVIWVQRAFGEFGGFFNSLCFMVSCLASQALSVLTFIQYFQLALNFSKEIEWTLRVAFVLASFLTNLWGLEYLSKLSWVMFIIIFSPFLAVNIAIVALTPRIPIDFYNLLEIPPYETIKWGVLISTVVWGLGGYDYVGSIAGEVKGGKRAFVIGILGTFPLNLVNYLYPLMLMYIIDNRNSDWEAGFFTKLVYTRFPLWLGIWMIISSAFSNFGALAGGMSQLAWTLWAMGRGPKDKVAKYRFLPYFVSWSWVRKGTVQPLMALSLIAAFDLGLSAIPYDDLSQFFLVMRSANVMCEYGALVYLRYLHPEEPRPFKIPGGITGTVLIALPTLGIIIFCFANMAFTDPWSLLVGAGSILGIILLYPIKKCIAGYFLNVDNYNSLQK